jgi:uncharacterized RDD family membrane protein YckC
MDIGTYADGRNVTYNETTHEFAIEGIRTTAELLVRYDKAGQVAWASDPLRSWVHEVAGGADATGMGASPYSASPAPAYGAEPASPAPAPYSGETVGYGVPQPAYTPPPQEWERSAAEVSAGFSPGVAAFDGGATQPISSYAQYSIAEQIVTPSSTNVVGRRYLAFGIDWLISGTAVGVLAFFAGIALAIGGASQSAAEQMGSLIGIVGNLLVLGYLVLSEAYFGTTIGKRALGLRVLQVDGNRITLVQALIRNLLLFVDVLFFTLPAFISMRNSDLHQRIGDLGAKTVIVRTLQ